MQPELQKIQKKYQGKKDQASMMKMQEETQAVYQKYGVSHDRKLCTVADPDAYSVCPVSGNLEDSGLCWKC